ncbi:hypothetical protein ACSQ6I_23530 [Anabaena sp. WFMT]|uniref:hypothetical protein n=1 Tax=Anabaena sp. WFMT TaxID=3449730 RepID=UPI003F1F59E6
MLEIKINLGETEEVPQGLLDKSLDKIEDAAIKTAIQNIQSNFYSFNELPPEIELMTRYIEGQWVMYFHWLYKKAYNNSYQPPRIKAYQSCKPMGYVLASILRLCKKMSEKWQYLPNPSVWFNAICWQMKRDHLIKALDVNFGKKAYLSQLREISKAYKNHEGIINPHNQSTEFDLWRLVDAIRDRSRIDPNIINEEWKDFTKALTVYTTAYEKHNTFWGIDKNTGLIYIEKSRQKWFIPHDHVVKLISQASSTPLQNTSLKTLDVQGFKFLWRKNPEGEYRYILSV